MTETLGRTTLCYEDYFALDPQPRIWENTDITDPEHPHFVYNVVLPCSHRARLSPDHDVEMGRDDTYTVRPNPPMNPNNSNSILCHECGWHGYIYDNVFTSV